MRQHGLYSHQLEQWKTELMSEFEPKVNKAEAKQAKDLETKIKQLEKELRCKDKALAEATVLLVLKKADLIFPVDEDN